MSYYVSSREEQRQARHPLNHKRVGLPADEKHDLDRAQRRNKLESHLNHSGDKSRAYKPSRTAYQDAGLSDDHRQKISEIRSATRAALGPSLDPFDEHTHRPARQRDQDYSRSRGWTRDVAAAPVPTQRTPTSRPHGPVQRPRSPVQRPHTAIPSKYRKEFNQRWHEDDMEHDANQYLADNTVNAPWRTHAQMDPVTWRGEPSTHHRRPRTAAPTGVHAHHQPDQTSAFNWAESVHEKPKRRFGFLNLFRRHH